jgi:hypothetical protein
MPCAVTAFGVKIVSPGNAGMELVIAREMVGEWNSLHAMAEKKVLVPLGAEGQTLSGDLLIAFFCTSQGAPGGERVQATESEIEKHFRAGAPVLVYYSEGRIDFAKNDLDGKQALETFKKRYESRATINSFGDEKELRVRLTRDLDAVIGAHARFRLGEASVPGAPPAVEASRPAALSKWAQLLLIEACEDPEAYIGRVKDGSSLKIQANGKQLVEQGNPGSVVAWDEAFHELLSGEMIRDAGCNGRLFQISNRGFEFLRSIGKSPVGYIAELGGM